MKNIIENILREEARASKILQDAKEEAGRIVKEADKEKEKIIYQAVSQAEAFSQEQKENFESTFIVEKKNILENVRKEQLVLRNKKNIEIPETARRIFSHIIDIR